MQTTTDEAAVDAPAQSLDSEGKFDGVFCDQGIRVVMRRGERERERERQRERLETRLMRVVRFTKSGHVWMKH